jgi:hypothetical protein
MEEYPEGSRKKVVCGLLTIVADLGTLTEGEVKFCKWQ